MSPISSHGRELLASQIDDGGDVAGMGRTQVYRRMW
jgi:hypothetical protein